MSGDNRMWKTRIVCASDDLEGTAPYAATINAPIAASQLARPSLRSELAGASLFAASPAWLRAHDAVVVLVEDVDTGGIAAACHLIVDGAGVGFVQGLVRTDLGDSFAPRIAVATAISVGADRSASSFSAKVRMFPRGRFTDPSGKPVTENRASRRLFTGDFAFKSAAVVELRIVGDWRDRHLQASAEPCGTYRTRVLRSTRRTVSLARNLLSTLKSGRAA